MKKILALLLSLLIVVTISGCKPAQDDDIYIVFTNDVHCAIEDNLGYSSVAALKKELQSEHKYVSLVDVGDFSSGSTIGTLTNGYGPTHIMNSVGYDVATLGNHEFDFKMDGLLNSIIDNAEFDIVCSNISYNGKKDDLLHKVVKPYVIKEFGNTKVAFVGVTAPSTIVESNPQSFKEDDETVYDFLFGDTANNFYAHLQAVIDEAHSKADYVILLTHCGTGEDCAPFRSTDISEKTYDVDVILDGHSHSQIVGEKHTNAIGKEIQIWQTGTQLASIGELVLTKDHTIEGLLISEYNKKDETVDNTITEINNLVNEKVQEVVGHTDFELTTGATRNDTFFRTIRSRETNLADLVTDAFRYVYEAQISLINGGAIRTNIEAGDITLKNILDVLPFIDNMCQVKVPGQVILDALEFSVHSLLPYTDDGETAVGEFGGFLQVSGIKFVVDSSIPSPVVSKDDVFDHVDGQRRVSEVYVQDGDEWVALDPNEEYTVSGADYILIDGGNGYSMFAGSEPIFKDGLLNSDCLAKYISTGLNGTVSQEYSESQGRIVVK